MEIFEDRGYFFDLGGVKYGIAGYDELRPIKQITDSTYEVELGFAPTKFFYPGVFSRLVLRIGGAIPGASTWLRRGIDWYRKTRKTAINQSAGPVASGNSKVILKRAVGYTDQEIIVTDVISTNELSTLPLAFYSLCGMEEASPQIIEQLGTLGSKKQLSQKKFFSVANHRMTVNTEIHF